MAVNTFVDGDLLRVVFYCRSDTQNGLMVHHYQVGSTAGSPISGAQCADAISGHVAATLKNCLSDMAEYRGCSVQRVTPLPATDRYVSTVGAGFGERDDPVAPGQVASVISLRTGFAGRSARGRKYVPFPPTSAVSPIGKLTAAYSNLVSLFAADLLSNAVYVSGLNTQTYSPVLYSKATNTLYGITAGNVNAAFGTQRRRSQVNKGDAPDIP